MSSIWNLLFIQPISQALFYLTTITGNLGVAIIVLTLAIQLVLTPLRIPSLRAAEKMKEMKPHLDGLKKKHKDDPQALMQAQMALYREHGVNPLGGMLPMLISLPIIFALYQVLQQAVNGDTGGVHFLWLNLAQPDSYYVLPVIVFVSQWVLTRISMNTSPASGSSDSSESDMAAMVQKNMQFMLPLMLGFITLRLPSGVGIYFVVSALFAIMQQVWIRKQLLPSKK